MSLKDKFEEIKSGEERKKTTEKIKKERGTLSEILDQKNTLINKIKELKDLRNQLENSYSSAQTSVEDFKNSKNNIHNLFNQYADSLKERGIESVDDILDNKDFSEEEEVIEYRKKGTGKIGKDNGKGKLGAAVENLSAVKTKVKAELPEMELDFRGGDKKREISPRKETLLKIREYVKKLETEELPEIIKKEAEIKKEYLPKLKELISNKIETVIPEKGNYSISPLAANITFISDEIFEFCGDEMWPEVKVMAEEAIKNKFKEKGINQDSEDIEVSLEAEKLIFDVQNLRSKHEKLLKLDQDRSNLSGLKRNLLSNPKTQVVIKDGAVYPAELLQKAEYYKEKNPAAKQVAEQLKEELVNFFEELKNKINPGWFTGGETKAKMAEVKAALEAAKLQTSQIKVPDNFFNQKRWELFNYFCGVFPVFSDSQQPEWLKNLAAEIIKKRDEASEIIQKPNEEERESLHKFDNDIYSFRDTGNAIAAVGGFDIPVSAIKEDHYYKKIIDKQEIDNFFSSISGKSMDKTELDKAFEQELKVFEEEIKNYPQSVQIIDKFKKLLEEFDEKYKRNYGLAASKLAAKSEGAYRYNSTDTIYEVKQKLFY
jgi:hypothetical protein